MLHRASLAAVCRLLTVLLMSLFSAENTLQQTQARLMRQKLEPKNGRQNLDSFLIIFIYHTIVEIQEEKLN